MNDINGVTIKLGDTVHCWDGDSDKRNVTQSLRGVVNTRKVDSGENVWFVGDNELALGCAEYVEVVG